MSQSSRRPCNVGLYLFQEEGWLAGGTAGWSDIKSMTQTAEQIGFDSVWLPDRLMRVRDGQQQGLWEAVTMLYQGEHGRPRGRSPNSRSAKSQRWGNDG